MPGVGVRPAIGVSGRLPSPNDAMRVTPQKICMLLTAIGLWCLPARAQLRTVANERGNLVFVYDGPVATAKKAAAPKSPATRPTAPVAAPTTAAPSSAIVTAPATPAFTAAAKPAPSAVN